MVSTCFEHRGRESAERLLTKESMCDYAWDVLLHLWKQSLQGPSGIFSPLPKCHGQA